MDSLLCCGHIQSCNMLNVYTERANLWLHQKQPSCPQSDSQDLGSGRKQRRCQTQAVWSWGWVHSEVSLPWIPLTWRRAVQKLPECNLLSVWAQNIHTDELVRLLSEQEHKKTTLSSLWMCFFSLLHLCGQSRQFDDGAIGYCTPLYNTDSTAQLAYTSVEKSASPEKMFSFFMVSYYGFSLTPKPNLLDI